MSAADVGSAHHSFLQLMNLERACTETDLRNEAERLMQCGSLTREEAAALDFDALLRFWQSPEGRRVLAEARFVHRELPFTARFTLEELAGLDLAQDHSSDEFVIVQGVVDLAILRPDSISIFDFKTDQLRPANLAAKTKEYEPQLRLYASALSRIYSRPVKELALHFLSLGETSPILVNRFRMVLS